MMSHLTNIKRKIPLIFPSTLGRHASVKTKDLLFCISRLFGLTRSQGCSGRLWRVGLGRFLSLGKLAARQITLYSRNLIRRN